MEAKGVAALIGQRVVVVTGSIMGNQGVGVLAIGAGHVGHWITQRRWADLDPAYEAVQVLQYRTAGDECHPF